VEPAELGVILYRQPNSGGVDQNEKSLSS